MSKGSCIHWFRKGLRLTDNPALLASLEAHKGSHLELRPVFVLDPWFVKHGQVGENRWRFLAQTLEDLDIQLKSLGSRLFVVRGSPKEVLPKLFKSWNVKKPDLCPFINFGECIHIRNSFRKTVNAFNSPFILKKSESLNSSLI